MSSLSASGGFTRLVVLACQFVLARRFFWEGGMVAGHPKPGVNSTKEICGVAHPTPAVLFKLPSGSSGMYGIFSFYSLMYIRCAFISWPNVEPKNARPADFHFLK